MILRRVQASDVASILDERASATVPAGPGAVQDRGVGSPHRAGRVRHADYPELPAWDEVPFFKGQKKIVLRNCGLINPDDIEEYIAVGGYQSLYKVLIDAQRRNW